MKLPRIFRDQSVFAQFFTTYALILLIPLVLAVGVNSAVVREFQDNVEESHLALLRQTRDVVERSIEDLEWRVFQIAASPRLNRLITEYRANRTSNPVLIREIVGSLNTFTLYSSSLKSTFYIYLQSPPIILTPYSMYHHDDFTDARTYLSIEGTSLEAWHDLVFSRYFRRGFFPVRRVTIEDFTNKPMIPYVQSFPINTIVDTDAITGAIVYFVGEDEFLSPLSNLALPEGGWAYIADERGQILTGLSTGSSTEIREAPIPDDSSEGLNRVEIDGEEMFVIHTQSPSRWKYVAVLPIRSVLSSVFQLQRVSLLTLMLSLLVSMAVAWVVAYRRSKPIQHILSSLKDIVGIDAREKAGIRSLDVSVQRLIDTSRHLQKKLENQEHFENLLVNRLLLGTFRNRNEAGAFFSYLGLKDTGFHFAAAVVNISGFSSLDTATMIRELNQSKVILKEFIIEEYGKKVAMYESDEDRLSLILFVAPEHEQSFREDTERSFGWIAEHFRRLHPAGITIGIGSLKSDIFEISVSYEQALRAVSLPEAKGEQTVIHFTPGTAEPQGCYYPIELEVRITNAVRAGDIPLLTELFEIVRSENIEKRELVGVQLRFLYHELFGTYQKLLEFLPEQADAGFPFMESASAGDAHGVEELIEHFFRIARIFHSTKRSHNTRLISNIQAFIQKNYFKQSLSLYLVASQFSITESYLSFFVTTQVPSGIATGVPLNTHCKA